MLMFTLAISCLITSNLPQFMNLTFQVKLYKYYIIINYNIITIIYYYINIFFYSTGLSPSDTSTTERHFLFAPAALFFLKLLVIALCSSPVAYWILSNLEFSFSSVISFCLFILFMGFSWQEYWSGLPFPPPMDHILSELFTMICPSWIAQHSMAHSFIELPKALCHDDASGKEPACQCRRCRRLGFNSWLRKIPWRRK